MEAFQRLEIEWSRFNDLDPAGMVACSSGTAALHLALEAFQLPPGSEVLVPDFTMVACARAVTLAGLTPVFVDCDERLLMDPLLVPHADEKASAVMVVHIYGRQLNFHECRQKGAGPNWCWIDETCRKGFPLRIVEDLAEAHGVKPQPETDAACWSFYRNKIIAGEEGGAVWFADPEHAKLARQLRSLGFTEAHDFMHVPRGHNYRMSNAHAELVLDNMVGPLNAMIPRDRILKERERRQIEGWYDAACPDEWRMPPRDAVWIFDVRVPGLERGKQAEVVGALNAAGIAARMGFAPMHWQEGYKNCRYVFDGRRCQSNFAAHETFYLPVSPGRTTEAECRRAFDVIRASLGRG